MPDVYRDNPNLKRANVQIQYTKEQVQEYAKCMEDPVYFTETYIKIVSLDDGLIPFKLYEFQRQMMWTFHTERFTICKLPRQSGKSTTIIASLFIITSIALVTISRDELRETQSVLEKQEEQDSSIPQIPESNK